MSLIIYGYQTLLANVAGLGTEGRLDVDLSERVDAPINSRLTLHKDRNT